MAKPLLTEGERRWAKRNLPKALKAQPGSDLWIAAQALKGALQIDAILRKYSVTKKSARARHGVYSNDDQPIDTVGEGLCIPKSERPKCGAKCRDGHACQAPAVWDYEDNQPRNGRCRIHGGLSTGPKTPEGRARIGEAAKRRARNVLRDC